MLLPTILVAEDDELTLNMLVKLLRAIATVFPAPHLSVARRHLTENAKMNIIILDGLMPEKAGMAPDLEASLAFIREIKSNPTTSEIIIVASSAEHNPDLVAAGADYVINKASNENVVERVLHILNKHSKRPASFT